MPNNIKLLRNKAGLTQAELAGKLEKSVSYINKIENGKKPISVSLALRIAKILDCGLDDIFS